MWRLGSKLTRQHLKLQTAQRCNSSQAAAAVPTHADLPKQADVVIIGGGSAGCHTLYHLAKRGVKAVLLERAKLTAGTTWHTAGLVWRLRPNDVDIQLLNNSRNMLKQLEAETGLDPGWIQNGGIFIAHSKTRLDEYKRLATVGDALGIENHILTPEETKKLFPLLDPKAFIGALYSPGDGVVDPAMLCTALTRAATKNGAKVFENCAVDELLVETTARGKRLVGVATPFGNIQTDTVVNATGVWGRDLIEDHGSYLPLIPMKHAYIVSESIPGVRGLPNIRDHDYSIYFRIQGESIQMGGYEPNPILLDPVANDFNFGLYDLDYSVFDTHLHGAIKLCPSYGDYGVKSTVCGPESFTPDHKPLMGPDTVIDGLYHNCGFNSAGMMFGGGCGEQTALWIINGQPDLAMFGFDNRRFTAAQNKARRWIREKSHESYAKNYSMVFKYDQPLAGRNYLLDPLHTQMLEANAFMEEKQGWERPAFFLIDTAKAEVLPYDWYGSYGHLRHKECEYEQVLEGDLKYNSFSEHHKLIGEEALACRNNAVVFNMSYFCKLFLEGPEAQKAADWIFTANTNRDIKKTVYTCALNDAGGVEADVTISKLKSGSGAVHDPKFQGEGFYIVAGGASAYYTYTSIQKELRRKGFNATVRDVTADMGVISIQGPKSREILQQIIDCNLSDASLPPNCTQLAKVMNPTGGTLGVRLLRVSFVGELGYELHVPRSYCPTVYKALMNAGSEQQLRNAGYRALYSLSSEKGYHLWSFDLRPDDTPIEAGLGFTCRKQGDYRGKQVIEKQRKEGIKKRLVYLTLDDQVPIWGLEGVYRNGEPISFIRRAEYAYTLGKPFGQAYLQRPDGKPIDSEYIKAGDYEVSIMGKRYKAKCHLRSPFDAEGKRALGIYN